MENKPGFMTLDSIGNPDERIYTLVKIDVEGAEVDVIQGGLSWLNETNLFVIEIHHRDYLDKIRDIFAERRLRLRLVDHVTAASGEAILAGTRKIGGLRLNCRPAAEPSS